MKFTLNRCAIALAASAALAASGAQARIVVDDNGTEVDIPERVNRVVVTNILPLASAVTVFLNDGKTVVGMHPASYSAAQSGLSASSTLTCSRPTPASCRAPPSTSRP